MLELLKGRLPERPGSPPWRGGCRIKCWGRVPRTRGVAPDEARQSPVAGGLPSVLPGAGPKNPWHGCRRGPAVPRGGGAAVALCWEGDPRTPHHASEAAAPGAWCANPYPMTPQTDRPPRPARSPARVRSRSFVFVLFCLLFFSFFSSITKGGRATGRGTDPRGRSAALRSCVRSLVFLCFFVPASPPRQHVRASKQ